MTDTQRYYIELARAAIFDDTPAAPPADTDWNYIYEKAASQNVTGLLASAVLRLEGVPDAERWENDMMMTMMLMSQRFAEFERMKNKAHEAGEDFICLKGVVLKDYYPVPELRTMGDFDILADDIDRAKEIFKAEGYAVENLWNGFTADSQTANWEVFYELSHEFENETEKYTHLMKENANVWENGIRTVDDTYFAAHVISHAAHHIKERGFGIRGICDTIICIKHLKYEEILMRKICIEQDCEKAYDYFRACAAVYFGVDIDYDKTLDVELFMEYILAYGVFGSDIEKNESMTMQMVLRKKGQSQFRFLFFPTVKQLLHRPQYSYLKKHPYLLPIAWVHRILIGIFKRGYTPGRTIKELKHLKSFGNERDEWIEKLGI